MNLIGLCKKFSKTFQIIFHSAPKGFPQAVTLTSRHLSRSLAPRVKWLSVMYELSANINFQSTQFVCSSPFFSPRGGGHFGLDICARFPRWKRRRKSIRKIPRKNWGKWLVNQLHGVYSSPAQDKHQSTHSSFPPQWARELPGGTDFWARDPGSKKLCRGGKAIAGRDARIVGTLSQRKSLSSAKIVSLPPLPRDLVCWSLPPPKREK